MGTLNTVLSFVRVIRNGVSRREVKLNPGGNPNLTGLHTAPPGDDSHPIGGDVAFSSGSTGTGKVLVVGYLDKQNQHKAGLGEKRIYSREAGGGQVAEIWLKNDGSVVVDNGSGSIELQSSGSCVINGVTIDTSGNIHCPGSLTADTAVESPSVVVNGRELDGHGHPYTWTDPGGAGTTGGNL